MSFFFFQKKFPADLVTFTEKILNGKIHFFCTVIALAKLAIRNMKKFLRRKNLFYKITSIRNLVRY